MADHLMRGHFAPPTLRFRRQLQNAASEPSPSLGVEHRRHARSLHENSRAEITRAVASYGSCKLVVGLYWFVFCCWASLTFADSSFFCVLARSFWSISAGTDLFHSSSARSQWAAASFSRPVF